MTLRERLRQALRHARSDYARVQKPRAVEDPGDLLLIRPLGFLLVQALRRTPITPNAVSAFSVVAAWATAWLYFRAGVRGNDVGWATLGLVGLLLYSALDSADGQLARVTGRTTEFGRVMDGLCDNLSFLGIYVAIVAATVARVGGGTLALALLTAVAAASHSLQAAASEYQRVLYLHHVHGSDVVRREEPDRLRGRLGDRPGILRRTADALHLRYAVIQRRLCPSSHALQRRLEELRSSVAEPAGTGPSPTAEATIARIYKRVQRPRMALWALLGTNSHKLGIAAAAFVPVTTAEPLTAGSMGMAWFFVYDLALNLVLAILILDQRRSDRRILAAVRTALSPRPAARSEG